MDMNPSDNGTHLTGEKDKEGLYPNGSESFPFSSMVVPLTEPDVREVLVPCANEDDLDFVNEVVADLVARGRVISSVSWRGRRVCIIHTRDPLPGEGHQE
jgi:hypothetical protein